MNFLRDKRGTTLTEWLVVAALAVVLAGVAIYGAVNNASTQGNNVGSWISSLNVPASS